MCIYEQLFSHRLLFKYERRKADLYVKINITFQLPGSLEQQCREMMEGSTLLCLLCTWKKNKDFFFFYDSTSAWFAVDQICGTYLLSAKYMSGTMGECGICLAFPCSRNLWEHAVVGMCWGDALWHPRRSGELWGQTFRRRAELILIAADTRALSPWSSTSFANLMSGSPLRVRVASRQGMLRIHYACIYSLLFPTCAHTHSKWAKGSMWELLLDTTVVSEYVLLQVRVSVLCPRRSGHMKIVLGLQALQGSSLIACRG